MKKQVDYMQIISSSSFSHLNPPKHRYGNIIIDIVRFNDVVKDQMKKGWVCQGSCIHDKGNWTQTMVKYED